jgi:LacI family transcriptional regulator
MVFPMPAHRRGDLLGARFGRAGAGRGEKESVTTIKDVARLAGVGLGTASRAISGHGSVAPATRQRVEQAVQALAFEPQRGPRRRLAKSMDPIGVYVPSFTGNFYAPLMESVQAELRAVGGQLIAACGGGAGDERQQALQGIDFLARRPCVGVVVAAPALTDADVVALQRRFAHLVFVNRNATGDARQCFAIDHELGGRLAARALLDRGHTRIACIAGRDDAQDNTDRMGGFHAELAEHGLRVPAELRANGNFTFAGGHAATRELLQRAPGGFSALFCANDAMAVAAIARLARANLRVPDDVSVLGFDDSDLATYTSPQLTTVRIPVEHMAANACRYLLNECFGLAQAVVHDFRPLVVWRQSVGRRGAATAAPVSPTDDVAAFAD